MTDYISRDDALNFEMEIEAAPEEIQAISKGMSIMSEYIKALSAADVVEVVRCKDCKWCHSGYCEMYDDLIPFGCANRPWEEWFCSDGEGW